MNYWKKVTDAETLNESCANEVNLKEKLLEEERKNAKMQQCIQQLKQQHAQLMVQLGSTTCDTDNSADDRSTLLIETSVRNNTSNKESSRMKQLEVQVQQMQEEMNKADKSSHIFFKITKIAIETHKKIV